MCAAISNKTNLTKETRSLQIFLRDKNIIETHAHPDFHDSIGIEEAIENFQTIKELCNPETRILVIMSNGKFTLEARKYYGDCPPVAKKIAIVPADIFNVIGGNFFLKFYQPKVPTKMFKDKEEAKVWLLEH